ncbi:MAG: SDR family oxidoreductase [Oscillatoriales cyanobacterium RU_3_3]|nr:SDR family oxidoreductase [Oscillatoriales cyanobacterium RU_3_3]
MENQFIKYPDLVDRTVVITGSNRGIGETIVQAFLSNQCRVVAVYRQDTPFISLPDIAGDRLILLQADIGDRAAFTNWLTEFESSGNRADILVNNAGVLKNTPLIECDENDWHYIMDINLKHTFFLSQLFARHMKKNGGGVIINASSFAAKIAAGNCGIYAASKSALQMLTKCMAAEWAPFGIRVNGFMPGMIPTRMSAPAIDRKQEQLINDISLHRFGTTEEIANGVLFLASNAASYITGTDLEISGGKFLIQDPESPWL